MCENNEQISETSGENPFGYEVFQYSGAGETSIGIGKGIALYLNNSKTRGESGNIVPGLESFGYILGSAGGIMSSVQNSNEQSHKNIKFINKTPYTIILNRVHGDKLNNAYVNESFSGLCPGEEGLLSFSLNTDSSLGSIDFWTQFIIMTPDIGTYSDPEKGQHVVVDLNLKGIGERFGFRTFNIGGKSYELHPGSFNNTIAGISVYGNFVFSSPNYRNPSFSIASFIQEQGTSDFSVVFLPFKYY
ncbi:hypothetical protein [Enterovibrio nigricans]|uniref:Uncharacterized protein n=1 Tax=Enterovibrio nigricans DSM 22720 TaxID=1121868 RepID=A0A1T4VP99_9GAMM|nr:hypothetical protein [Enterovibrio nigricans]PKF49455.1 hypothetical protein AT251_18710 [Enterovibrio nigricans]SKA66749.1 hypothetical protein SAMN02745132_04140 [Enterovibrio nigricans DSM 22720]